MIINDEHAEPYVQAIRNQGLSIYDPIKKDNSTLWIPTLDLERILNEALTGVSLKGLFLRSRSKIVKEYICRALGYPVPSRFKKTHPRFIGQQFDVYVQKSNNLQIWNTSLESARRYVLVRTGKDNIITCVKVVTGNTLENFVKTGSLTQKYQARLTFGHQNKGLLTPYDTETLRPLVNLNPKFTAKTSPADYPQSESLLSIQEIFQRLQILLGSTLPHLGYDQERKRGNLLHQRVCRSLGYAHHQDTGSFPDIKHQLLEIKLQTSTTIDLGMISPNSTNVLNIPLINKTYIRHCDVRYAVFYGKTQRNSITLTHLLLCTGEQFYDHFTQYKGKILNKKIQILLPANFFG